MTISIVIPTIKGRDDLFDRTVEAFEATTDEKLQFIVPRDRPTCGEAWNDGALLAGGEYLLLAADDMLPHEGWAEAAITAAQQGVYPAPWIVNADGSTLCCGTLGSGLLLDENASDGQPVCNSPVPFMRRDMWDRIGPTIPAHCYSDDYLGYRARLAGLSVEVRRGFKFTHLDGLVGHRPLVMRSQHDRQMYADAVSRLEIPEAVEA